MPLNINKLRQMIANELTCSIVENNKYKTKEDNEYDVSFTSVIAFSIFLRIEVKNGGSKGNNLCLLALSNRYSYKIVIFTTLTNNLIIYRKDNTNTLYFRYNHEEEEYCAFIDKNCKDDKINNK